MKRLRYRNLLFVLLCSLLLVAGLVVLPIARQLRQEQKDTALIAAVKANDAKAVVRLLAEGADANAKDRPKETRPFWLLLWETLSGQQKKAKGIVPTALLAACTWRVANAEKPENISCCDLSVVQTLLEHGADPNVVCDGGLSPLCYRLMLGNQDQENAAADLLLIRHGAKLDLTVAGVHWPLFVQAARHHPDPRVLLAMLQRGTDVNVQWYGTTALMNAAHNGDARAVGFLLDHQASIEIKDRQGHTALYYALRPARSASPADRKQILRILRQAGAHQSS